MKVNSIGNVYSTSFSGKGKAITKRSEQLIEQFRKSRDPKKCKELREKGIRELILSIERATSEKDKIRKLQELRLFDMSTIGVTRNGSVTWFNRDILAIKN